MFIGYSIVLAKSVEFIKNIMYKVVAVVSRKKELKSDHLLQNYVEYAAVEIIMVSVLTLLYLVSSGKKVLYLGSQFEIGLVKIFFMPMISAYLGPIIG